MARTLDAFLHDGRLNNLVGWGIILLLAGVLIESLLELDVVWAGFTGTVMIILILPTIKGDDHQIRIPWEFLLLASLPITTRALDIPLVRGPIFFYLSFAALALIIAVEIHLYTDTRMNHWFAIVVVSLTTIAVAGTWAVARWYADSTLGTALLPDHDTLMLNFVAATGVGIGAGIFFDLYFKQLQRGVES